MSRVSELDTELGTLTTTIQLPMRAIKHVDRDMPSRSSASS
jgi:hypothetical protein